MFVIHLPEDAVKASVSRVWDLGSVSLTEGATAAVEDKNVNFDLLLLRHWSGDYGLISNDEHDHYRTAELRNAGRPFMSLFHAGEHCIKVISNPDVGRTVVCLTRED